jgi:hypothetical protein
MNVSDRHREIAAVLFKMQFWVAGAQMEGGQHFAILSFCYTWQICSGRDLALPVRQWLELALQFRNFNILHVSDFPNVDRDRFVPNSNSRCS